MSTVLDPAGHDELLGLLDGLIYADVFDCAVTLDELWRYGRVAIDRSALERLLREDPVLREIVAERDGLYCLADRSALIDLRPQRLARAKVLQRRARRVASVLRVLPFIRGLALTGSVAANDAGQDADVDLFVVVAPERLSMAFLVLGSGSRLFGRRFFCPNYYVSEERLVIEPRTLYVARELAQARALAGDLRALGSANPWPGEIFPNADWPASLNGGPHAGSLLQRWLETPLRGPLGDRIEGWARRVALTRLRAHYGAFGQNLPSDVEASFRAGVALRFHRSQVNETALSRYAARCEEVMAALNEPRPGMRLRQSDPLDGASS